ncbi:SCP-like protein [Aphelenchoides besseyi]|nr:SCP-like protein [Aphelenchoides besseyi]
MNRSIRVYLLSFIFSLTTLSCVSLVLEDVVRKEVTILNNQHRRSLANGEVKNAAGTPMPKATDMNQIKYNKELEAKAQDWAAKCDIQKEAPAGVLIYHSKDTMDHATAMVKAFDHWWKQVEKYDTTNVKYTVDSAMKFGDFAQVALSQNKAVGCAIEKCQGTFVVCSYDAILEIGKPIYKTGTPCTQCDPSKKQCQRGLCSSCIPKRKS